MVSFHVHMVMAEITQTYLKKDMPQILASMKSFQGILIYRPWYPLEKGGNSGTVMDVCQSQGR